MNPLHGVGVALGEVVAVALGLGDAVRSRVGVNVGVAGAKVGDARTKGVGFGTGEGAASHPSEAKIISKMTQAILTLYDRGIRGSHYLQDAKIVLR